MTSTGSSEENLDFSAPIIGTAGSPACASCGRAIDSEYWSVGAAVICAACRTQLAVQEGDGASLQARGMRFIKALLFGIGGMVAGAAVWYGVAKFLNLEIGLIAILLGWLVGKGVMKGTDERGGRRYQVMAVLLTYFGIGLGYLPFAFQGEAAKATAATTSSIDSTTTAVTTPVPDEPATAPSEAGESHMGVFGAIGALLLVTVALPFYVVEGTFPGSLISVLIYGFAILQAWRMTASRQLAIDGPFKLGSSGTA